MTDKTRPNAFHIADQRGLDFLNSIGAPFGSLIEWIDSGDQLLDWMIEAQLIESADAVWFKQNSSRQELDEVAQKARELREYFRKLIADHAGQTIEKVVLSKLDQLNQLLFKDHQYMQIRLDNENGGLNLKMSRQLTRPENLLTILANEMASCICDADFSRIKNCENEPCTLWFLDTSKNGRRRWCSMKLCGNRAKAAAHRKRNSAN